MTKKKDVSVISEFDKMHDVFIKSGLDQGEFITHNGNLIYPSGSPIGIFKVDSALMEVLISDYNDDINLKEADPHNIDNSIIRNVTILDMNCEWIPIEDPSPMYSGNALILNVDGSKVAISRQTFPVKLKKNEYTDISYSVICVPDGNGKLIVIRKEFKSILPECNWSAMTMFHLM